MDLFLLLDLLHALSAIAWLAGGAVLALILLTAARDDASARRAVPEADLIGRRVLRPAGLAALMTGLALAAIAGLALQAWVILSAALIIGSLAARPLILAPAFARAARYPDAVPQALALVRWDLAAQLATLALMIARPGWTGAAILAGLATCIALALALLRSLPGEEPQVT